MGASGYAGEILNDGAITSTGRFTVGGGSFTFDADDTVGGTLYVQSGAVANTATSANVTSAVSVTGNNSRLNVGATLDLTGDISVYGGTSAAATLDAQGHDIRARTITVGSTWAGALLNDGAITAQDLTIQDGSSVLLTGGDDVILDDLVLDDGGILTIAQAVGELTGLTLDGDSLDIDTTSLLTLAFDSQLVAGLDWAFRWANPTGGDRVGTLLDYITDGLIAWAAPWAVAVFDQGDGYTYIGYKDAQVPVPAGLGVVSLLVGTGWLGWRRRRVGGSQAD